MEVELHESSLNTDQMMTRLVKQLKNSHAFVSALFIAASNKYTFARLFSSPVGPPCGSEPSGGDKDVTVIQLHSEWRVCSE